MDCHPETSSLEILVLPTAENWRRELVLGFRGPLPLSTAQQSFYPEESTAIKIRLETGNHTATAIYLHGDGSEIKTRSETAYHFIIRPFPVFPSAENWRRGATLEVSGLSTPSIVQQCLCSATSRWKLNSSCYIKPIYFDYQKRPSGYFVTLLDL